MTATEENGSTAPPLVGLNSCVGNKYVAGLAPLDALPRKARWLGAIPCARGGRGERRARAGACATCWGRGHVRVHIPPRSGVHPAPTHASFSPLSRASACVFSFRSSTCFSGVIGPATSPWPSSDRTSSMSTSAPSLRRTHPIREGPNIDRTPPLADSPRARAITGRGLTYPLSHVRSSAPRVRRRSPRRPRI